MRTRNVVLCLCAVLPLAAADRLPQIAPRMKSFVEHGEIAGAVTLASRNGTVQHLEAVGWQDKEKQTPMKTDTIFEIMSMTKPVTAAGIQMLAEEGLLALTDPVEKHLPEFRGQRMIASHSKDSVVLKAPSRPITIRDLLTHTSGMPEMPPAGAGGVGLYRSMNLTLAHAVHLFSQMPLEFEPGAKWSYSNTGMATLGRIIEVVSDRPYETFLEERVFRPLGMKDTFFFPPPDKLSRIAAVYTYANGKLSNAGDGIYRKRAKYPMPEGGLYSTAADLAAFYQMMLNGGVYQGKRLLSKASVQMVTSDHTPGMARDFGLGWAVTPRDSLNLTSKGAFGHGGAFGTFGWVDPAKNLVGVFLIQRMGGSTDSMRDTFVEMVNASITE